MDGDENAQKPEETATSGEVNPIATESEPISNTTEESISVSIEPAVTPEEITPAVEMTEQISTENTDIEKTRDPEPEIVEAPTTTEVTETPIQAATEATTVETPTVTAETAMSDNDNNNIQKTADDFTTTVAATTSSNTATTVAATPSSNTATTVAATTSSNTATAEANGLSPPLSGNTNLGVSKLTPSGGFLNEMEGTSARELDSISETKEKVIGKSNWNKSMEKLRIWLDSTGVSVVMSLVTIFALFGDDIRMMHASINQDIGFTAVLIIALILFAVEFTLSCIAIPEYSNWTYKFGTIPTLQNLLIGSFYFYLDIIATVSLAVEIDWDGQTETAYDLAEASGSEQNNTASSGWSKRLVTMARMVRIVRMVKFYKYYQVAKKKSLARERAEKKRLNQQRKSFNKPVSELNADEGVEEKYQESRVGQAMTDLTTQRVIGLIFTLLLVIPLLTYEEDNLGSVRYKARLINMMNIAKTADSSFLGFDSTLSYIYAEKEVVAILEDTNFLISPIASAVELEDLRASEINYYKEKNIRIFENNTRATEESAMWSTLLSTFVTILLMVGTYLFSNDVTTLVITPIERMVALVQKISVNPLGVEYTMMGAEDGFMEGMETTLLLQTINKIGSLMRVGFGDAGANTIAKNLAESKGGRLNMMGTGTRIHAIFGFCDVRQFTDTTECLQEEVMLFVNRIAHILHSIVVQCSGSANKNIGDAFLLTWKVDEKLPMNMKQALADQALVAFLKGLVELNRHQDFICNFTPQATARLYKRFPGYNVRIGCGLHYGWAIEGAIGSYRKIDASYLSPSVNMSEYLESSTKAYGVPILLSEPFFELLTPQATKYCRQVDRIFGPLDDPFGMYTYDADLEYDFNAIVATTSALKAANVFKSKLAARKASRESRTNMRRSSMFSGLFNPDEVQAHVSGVQAMKAKQRTTAAVPAMAAPSRRGSAFNDIEMQKINDQQKKIQAEKKNKAPEIKVNHYEKGVWERDSDLIQLRHQVNESFRATWKTGIDAYISGDWPKAISVFNTTKSVVKAGDGPSMFLLNLMEKEGNVAPKDWKGYRLD